MRSHLLISPRQTWWLATVVMVALSSIAPTTLVFGQSPNDREYRDYLANLEKFKTWQDAMHRGVNCDVMITRCETLQAHIKDTNEKRTTLDRMIYALKYDGVSRVRDAMRTLEDLLKELEPLVNDLRAVVATKGTSRIDEVAPAEDALNRVLDKMGRLNDKRQSLTEAVDRCRDDVTRYLAQADRYVTDSLAAVKSCRSKDDELKTRLQQAEERSHRTDSDRRSKEDRLGRLNDQMRELAEQIFAECQRPAEERNEARVREWVAQLDRLKDDYSPLREELVRAQEEAKAALAEENAALADQWNNQQTAASARKVMLEWLKEAESVEQQKKDFNAVFR